MDETENSALRASPILWELGIVPGAEVEIVKDGKRFVLVVNPADGIKKKWRGRFRNGCTTEAYLEEVRGRIN